MISIPIEISARHVHLKSEDWATLFGADEPTRQRDISQPPQFVAAQRVTIRGPKGEIGDVAVVGPFRTYTQVELSATDARRLGLEAPLSDSGRLFGASDVTLVGPAGRLTVRAAMIQRRHIHASPDDLEKYGLKAGQLVSVTILGERGGRLDHVAVKTHASYRWMLHLDTDEGNALGAKTGMYAEVVTT